MGWKPSGTTDDDAIHDNVSGEIAAIVEKAAPVDADLVVIEDSAAANVKKRVQVGNLPGGGGGANPIGTWLTEVDADAPIAHLRLDEAAGGTAADRTGNGNTGTYVGPTLGATGVIHDGNDAVSFDGTNDYINWDTIAGDLATLDVYTLEGWFKQDDYTESGGFGRVLFAANTSGGGNRWQLRVNENASGTAEQGTITLNESISSDFTSAPHIMQADAWNHVVMVYKDGLMVVYFNTHPIIGDYHASNFKIVGTDLISIGQEWDGGSASDWFKGDVDDCVAYDIALTPERVHVHYRAGLAL